MIVMLTTLITFSHRFFDALHTLGVDLEIIYAHDLYRQGLLDKEIITALEQTETIKRILHDSTGKAETDEWSPFNPLCDACGRLTHTRVTGFDAAEKTVSYICECGSEGTNPVSCGGKLTWRVDWPARWHALGVTIEPFGKDHATRGGSYDSGQRIVREVFDGIPPHPILYEWIGLKGQGDMSSSKGNLVSIENLIQTIPPEVIRYMIFRSRPNRHIGFDPGLPLLNLVDEYDNITGNNRNQRAAELALLADSPPLGLPFKHLVNLVQITDGSLANIVPILQRHNLPIPDLNVLQSRITYAQHWLKEFSPPDIRLQLQNTLPKSVAGLTDTQRQVLGDLANRIEPTMDGDSIHALVYKLAEEIEIAPKELFQAIYTAFLDQPRGPRVGWFLSSLNPDFVRARLHDAAQTV